MTGLPAIAGHTIPGGAEAQVLPAVDPLPLTQQQLHRHLPLLQGHIWDRQHCWRSCQMEASESLCRHKAALHHMAVPNLHSYREIVRALPCMLSDAALDTQSTVCVTACCLLWHANTLLCLEPAFCSDLVPESKVLWGQQQMLPQPWYAEVYVQRCITSKLMYIQFDTWRGSSQHMHNAPRML